MPSIHYITTDVYSYQPTYKEFICTNLFLTDLLWESFFMRIFLNLSYLWESFLPMKIFLNLSICENLFLFAIICMNLCFYESKLAYEYHHLKQIPFFFVKTFFIRENLFFFMGTLLFHDNFLYLCESMSLWR